MDHPVSTTPNTLLVIRTVSTRDVATHTERAARKLASFLGLTLAACTSTPSPDLGAVHEPSSPAGDTAVIDRTGAASVTGNGGAAANTTPTDADADAEPPPTVVECTGAACVSGDGGDSASTTPTDADAGSELPPTPRHVWRSTSARVRLAQFSYWTGGSRFENARDALTKDQLAALEGIILEDWDGRCVEDGLSASLTIVDQDGSEVVYETSAVCDRAEGQVLDVDSMGPFLETLPCLKASETRDAQTTPATAPLLEAADGCEHGFFGSPPWLMLNVTKTDVPYTIRGLNCQHNQVELALYDELGKTLLAEAAAEAAPGCQMIRYTFSSAGKYALELNGMGGDYFLEFTHE